MTLSHEEMFYLATGLLDVDSWTSSRSAEETTETSCYNERPRTIPKCCTARNHSQFDEVEEMSSSAMLLPSRPANRATTLAKTSLTNQHSSSPSSLLPHSTRWSTRSLNRLSWRDFYLTTLLIFLAFSLPAAEGCSSRSTPKPRPPPPLPSPTPAVRPNITFQTYACPPAYATYYCLNGATCFTIKIGESILYNCECTEGFMGQRCEYKDLEGSYLPLREKIMLERASIAGGATVAVVLVVIISIIFYTYVRQQKKEQRLSFEQVTMDKSRLRNHSFSSCNSFRGLGATHLKNNPLFHHHLQPVRISHSVHCETRAIQSRLDNVNTLRVHDLVCQSSSPVERTHNDSVALAVSTIVSESCQVPKRDQTVVVLSKEYANNPVAATKIDLTSSS